jgi:hypothetical protein
MRKEFFDFPFEHVPFVRWDICHVNNARYVRLQFSNSPHEDLVIYAVLRLLLGAGRWRRLNFIFRGYKNLTRQPVLTARAPEIFTPYPGRPERTLLIRICQATTIRRGTEGDC